MKKLLLILILFTAACTQPTQQTVTAQVVADNKIQVALLLDVSNSMDGLIDQAKSQLWKMVNELALAKKNGQAPYIEIALYEYGKSSLPKADDYIRQITPLTTNLDYISEELFKLKTNGGDEYCGAVIAKSISDLKWDDSNEVLKMIIIAGNEPFNQGSVSHEKACKDAIQKGIIVNTIFCGNYDEGMSTYWKNGALLADGKYMNIDLNQQVAHIDTPQDTSISRLNSELNKTYIGYGSEGKEGLLKMEEQDYNAGSYSISNKSERAVTKASSAYKNSSWDLVDAKKDKTVNLQTLADSELPAEMKDMKPEEREKYVDEMGKKRKDIQDQIQKLNVDRQKYIAEKQKSSSETNTLDKAIETMIKEQAAKKNYQIVKPGEL